ncbi:MAG: hypothetical protein EPO16_12130 [Dehalococcoidia bacterium]|nr:MAG: hypothetical protein EPO16_12130 [Dehalococcoidia bacterium]
MIPILRLAVPVVAAALLVACNRGDKPAPTSTASPAASVTATPTSTASAATATATASATPTATASRTPTAFPTGPAGPTPPAGYATSCAAAFPWGRQVTRPFVCIEEPKAAAAFSRGGPLLVRGYAGGSFENNVVVQVRLKDASGRLPEKPLFQVPLTYVAPDAGMPGFWQVVFTLPGDIQASDGRVTALFFSPKDGAVVAETSVDIVVR